MSLLVQRQDTQESLTLALQPFASGGEGELYAITAPASHTDYVVKIYHRNKRDAAHREKLAYLLAHRPPVVATSRFQLVWPEAIITAEGQFVGYLMPRAQGEKLEVLCALQWPRTLTDDWSMYDRQGEEHIAARLQVCLALAEAVQVLHQMHRYVLVDLKPDNILVQPNGHVSIVDMDSVQVADEEGNYHLARVATPEYAPPEYFEGTRPTEATIFETWDRYSLAVIAYKVLCGIHPFAGTAYAPYDQQVNLQDKIQHGLFVHAPVPDVSMRIIPPPHRAFHELPAALQQLWVRCFNYGHQQDMERPTAQEWAWQLASPSDSDSLRPLPSSLVTVAATDAKPLGLLPTQGVLTTADIPRPQPAPTYLPQPLPFASGREWRRMMGGGSLLLLVAAVVVMKGAAIVAGVAMAAIISLVGFHTMYYLDHQVRTKYRLQRQLARLGRERRKQRQKVLNRIREIQRFPRLEHELIPHLQAQQATLASQYRTTIQARLHDFKMRLRHWDREVIHLNRSMMRRLHELNQRLSANLWQATDLSPDALPRQVRALPLPKLVKWLNEEAEHLAVQWGEARLTAIRRKADELLATYQTEEQTLLGAQSQTYNRALAEAEKARQAYEAAVDGLKQETTTRIEAAIEDAMADKAQAMRRYLQLQQDLQQEVATLKKCYAEYDEVASKSLKYRDLKFLKYLKETI